VCPYDEEHRNENQQSDNHDSCHSAPRNFRYAQLRHIYNYYIASGPVVKGECYS
jgi:hypothetical protein